MWAVEVAAALRLRADEVDPAFSTRALIGKCFPGTMVTGANLPDGIDEMVSWSHHGPVIVYQRKLSGPQQRFAIAHAMAHLLFDRDSDGASLERLGDPVTEMRADAFAAELLAPLHLVAECARLTPSDDPEDHEIYLDHVDEIASMFAVPADIIDSRIRMLK